MLDIAAELFARDGYRATNLKLVAERLDVTRQALYHHFDSKPAILGALFARVLDKLEAAVDEAGATAGAGESRFAAMLHAHLSVVAANRDLIVVLHRERPEMAKLEGLRSVARSDAYFERFVRPTRMTLRRGRFEPSTREPLRRRPSPLRTASGRT